MKLKQNDERLERLVGVRLTRADFDALGQLAMTSGETISTLLRAAIRDQLRREHDVARARGNV